MSVLVRFSGVISKSSSVLSKPLRSLLAPLSPSAGLSVNRHLTIQIKNKVIVVVVIEGLQKIRDLACRSEMSREALVRTDIKKKKVIFTAVLTNGV